MYQKNFKYPDTKAHEFVIARLAKRGVSLDELAKLVYETQKDFELGLTLEECKKDVNDVMHKRELLNNAMVMLELDRLTEEGKVASPLSGIIKKFDTSPEHVNTFIDDLLAAIVAATCGKIAHKYA